MSLRVNNLSGLGGGGRRITFTLVDSAVSSVDSMSYTFSSRNLGSGQAIMVVVGGNMTQPSSVTAGGQSLSKEVATYTGFYSNNRGVSVWIGNHPGVDTGDIVVNFGTNYFNCLIAVIAIDGLQSLTAVPVFPTSDNGANPLDLTMNVEASAFVIGAGLNRNSAGPDTTSTWSILTELATINVENFVLTVAAGIASSDGVSPIDVTMYDTNSTGVCTYFK